MMLKQLSFASILVFILSGSALALGFGDITVFSKLNEPLKLHIELVSSKSTLIDDISIKHADLNTYRRANLPRPDAFNRVKFKPVKLANGSVVVVITTTEPVKEPFITFIAELNWPQGRLNREYTFLLDPPEFVKKHSQPKSYKKETTKKATITTRPDSTFSKKSNRKTQTSPVDYSTVIAAHVPDKTYTTVKSDTLWNIAKKFRPDSSVTTYQTMQALHLLNPEAFIKNDINRLKQGHTLSIPTRDEILQLNGKQARLSQKIARSKPSTEAELQLKKQMSSKSEAERSSEISAPSDTTQAKFDDEGRLKIIPPTGELLNRPVNDREDLKLINKALKTSIETITLLKKENDELAARIEQLTQKISSLDSENDQLDSQINHIESYIKENSPAESAAPQKEDVTSSAKNTADKLEATTYTEKTLVIESDLKPQNEKSRSFIRELLTSPIITIALAIFTIIILIAILFTLIRQNEKRKIRKKNTYSELPPREKPVFTQNIITSPVDDSSVHQSLVQASSPAQTDDNKAEKDEDDMDFFEYFEKKINAPEESIDNEQQGENVSTLANNGAHEENEEVQFSLDISDQEIAEYEKKISQSYEASVAPSSGNRLSEVDTYIAYGAYDKAEKLLQKELINTPSDKNLNLKLLECYTLSNKRYEFMKHVKTIVNLLNVDMVLRHRVENLYQQAWNETLSINKFT